MTFWLTIWRSTVLLLLSGDIVHVKAASINGIIEKENSQSVEHGNQCPALGEFWLLQSVCLTDDEDFEGFSVTEDTAKSISIPVSQDDIIAWAWARARGTIFPPKLFKDIELNTSIWNRKDLRRGGVVDGKLASYSLVQRFSNEKIWPLDGAISYCAEELSGARTNLLPDSFSLTTMIRDHILWQKIVESDQFELQKIESEAYEATFSQCILPLLQEKAKIPAFMDRYNLQRIFSVGGQGEVWRAVRMQKKNPGSNEGAFFESSTEDIVVLKRVFVERGEKFRLAGLREAVFGKRLRDYGKIARFVETFNRTVGTPGGEDFSDEMWLVFEHEGSSLDSLLYVQVRVKNSLMIQPSALWNRMRQNVDGAHVRREIIRQLLEGLVILNKKGIAHRDIKPSNILVSEDYEADVGNNKQRGTKWGSRMGFRVKISDFGSAVDVRDSQLNFRLYGKAGPTSEEETSLYRPPEAFLGGVSRIRFPYLADDESGINSWDSELPFHAFDMWSVGVVALEMLLGTPKVFELDSRSRARVYSSFQSASGLDTKKKAILELRYARKALENFGIYAPRNGNRTLFNETVTRHDPLKRGFYFYGVPSAYYSEQEMKLYGDEELDLIWSLLSWSPFRRPSPKEALRHPYFSL